MTNLSSPLFDILSPWSENHNAIWLASTFLLHRNIERFNFPSKLALDKRRQLVSLIGKEGLHLAHFSKPFILKSEECTPLEKEYLVEHCLTNESFIQAHQGEAFIFDHKGDCLVTINIEDHLRVHLIDVQEDLENSWNKLVKLEGQLNKNLALSYSSKFGFLTADSNTCGTGLVVSAFLQLSGLIHSGTLKEILANLKEDSISSSSLHGDADELIGDLLVLQNNFTLGVNEETIIATLRSFVTKLMIEESKVRIEIKQSGNPEIKDKIARAYGLLIHSYQIETLEALNEIALLKLGVEMEWVKGITLQELNRLFFCCRRAHLLRQQKEKIAFPEVPHARAEFIHAALKNVTLMV